MICQKLLLERGQVRLEPMVLSPTLQWLLFKPSLIHLFTRMHTCIIHFLRYKRPK